MNRRDAEEPRKAKSAFKFRLSGPRRLDSLAARDGRIARYAWGDDYHDLIEKKLRVLDDWLAARGRTAAALRRYRAGAGARLCRARRRGLARQKHDAHSPEARHLVLPRGNPDDARSRARRADCRIAAGAARAASTPARPARSPRRTSSMRGAAFPISRSS